MNAEIADCHVCHTQTVDSVRITHYFLIFSPTFTHGSFGNLIDEPAGCIPKGHDGNYHRTGAPYNVYIMMSSHAASILTRSFSARQVLLSTLIGIDASARQSNVCAS